MDDDVYLSDDVASFDLIVKAKENATISVDAPAVPFGDNVTVSVTLPEDATGSVTIGNDTVSVVNGTAVAVLPGLSVGNYTVPVIYSGDDKYYPIETEVNVSVKIRVWFDDCPVSVEIFEGLGNFSIRVIDDEPVVVSNVTVKATVDDVVLYAVSDSVGLATFDLSSVPAGNYTPVVVVDDDVYLSDDVASFDLTVKAKENATISVDAPAEANEGDNVTVTVTLPVDATGSVTIGNEAVPVQNGTASAVLTNLPVGNITVPVTYSGDDKYNPIETEVNITVNEDKSDIVKAPDVTKYFGGPERFVVNVTDYKGNPLANKSVTIAINGRSYTRITDENGIASMALNLNGGIYNVTSTVDNQTVNSVVTVLSTVNGTDVVKMYRNGTQYYATFLDSEGKYLADGTAVKFNINGVMYERKVSGDKGLARLNINLPEGEYIITAINPKTGENTANNITVLATLVENKDITKYFKNATQYTVKVIGADGKVAGAGEKVIFNINGVMYTRTTDESGIAVMNINLIPGDYVITAEYNGYKVSNKITVLPILTAKDVKMKYRDGTKFAATLVDGQGKPYVGQTVQFNINGVIYQRATNSSGQARLNINLLPGEYIITSSFNGAKIANKITISG